MSGFKAMIASRKMPPTKTKRKTPAKPKNTSGVQEPFGSSKAIMAAQQRWKDVLKQIKDVAQVLSRCEHDTEPLERLILGIYGTGFAHGREDALPNSKKLGVKPFSPTTLIQSALRNYAANIMASHTKGDDTRPPHLRN